MANYLHALRQRRRKRRTETPARGGADQRVAVIGLGRFGSSLAGELMLRGWDVLGHRHRRPAGAEVQRRASPTPPSPTAPTPKRCTSSASTSSPAPSSPSAPTSRRASWSRSNLLEAQVPNIWAKAISRQHGQILERLGAHHVVLPEHEMGERVAHLVTGRMLDFIEFDDDYALVKTVAPQVATGMPLGESRGPQPGTASPSSASSDPARTSPTRPPTPSSRRATSSSSPARPTRWSPSPN